MPLPKKPKVLGDHLNDESKKNTVDISKTTSKPTSIAKKIESVEAIQKHVKNTPAIKTNIDSKIKTHIKPNIKSKVNSKINNSTSLDTIAINTQKSNKMFVLDTNVLLHDPSSLFKFHENSLFLPMVVLEELDNHKKGLTEVARNARSISRTLDDLLKAKPNLDQGIPLNILGHKDATGILYFQTQELLVPEVKGFINTKADNHILGVVRALQVLHPHTQIVLVSKDINMRIKANALNIPAEEYYSDHVVEDLDLLYSGYLALPDDFWSKHSKNMESWQNVKNGITYYRIQGSMVKDFYPNQMLYLDADADATPFYAQVIETDGKTAVLQTLVDYTHTKNNIWGITARNREQNFALNLLMNPDIDFVTLLGQAGTGKTLLALAAAIEQVLEHKLYNQIIVTRATVPLGEDIGFLPGTEEEKMQPWMGALDDNLEVLQQNDNQAGEWGKATNLELIRSKIKIKSMSFMRGRTFVNKLLIIDEAQNLTPKQIKALITRAGPNTKIICMGNIAQIDTPYLSEGSSGITYVVDRFKGWQHSGHITLARGERSRLAEHASDVL
jgi:PhoH-like ATPase